MRDYSKAGPRFWTGETGKYLRRLGRDAQVIGFYLFTCPNANMIGLYYLPLATLVHETGVPIDTARVALEQISRAPSEGLGSPFEGVFARYDEVSETVFVTEMARHQVGEHLSRKDNRHKAVVRELEQYRKTPFFNDFLNRYRVCFALEDVPANKPLQSPLVAPSKPGAGAGAETRAGTGHSQSGGESPTDSARTSEGKGSDLGHCDPTGFTPLTLDQAQQLQGAYPVGIYRQSEWIPVEKLANFHLEAGVPFEVMLSGEQRYNAQCLAREIIGTQYVLSPVKFFDRETPQFADPFPLPKTKAETRQDSNVDAMATWLARKREAT